MKWNWQLPKWPHFQYDSAGLGDLEKKFFQEAGGASAILRHLEADKKKLFIIELLCLEGFNSSAIEGELLERHSLQSSIQCHFGIQVKAPGISGKEKGMGELMWLMYSTYDQVLTHETLFTWHKTLMNDESKINDIGKYRSHDEPMQIISGRLDRQTVFFEAPSSKIILPEMNRFIEWFNSPAQKESTLARAAITHLYFESIHPFEDGNGRIGRALVEKSLSQALNHPTLIAVSREISSRKKEYYTKLAACNHTLEITEWIHFFADIILHAQGESFRLINFLMAKSRIMHSLDGKINPRQEKVLLRIFAEGPNGFAGGLSAENYIAITKTSRATATRDLTELVKFEVLYKTGHLRHTRYWLNVESFAS